MKRYLAITIDVEPDCSPGWKYSDPVTFNGVHEGIGEKLQPLFNKYGFTPTYLINNVVLEDQASCETIKRLPGNFEAGTHLHPEFIEPQKSEFDYAGKKGEANCCFYEPHIEFAKLENITNLFKERFGKAPTSFRAGRFSAGGNTIRSLTQLKYKVDTSVTPFIRWDDKTRERPVDFRHASNQPYWVSSSSLVNAASEQNLLEVPVSILGQRLSTKDYVRSILKNKRIPYNGSRPIWLRPKFSSNDEFKWIVQSISSNIHQDTVVFNMMFHNVEVLPGLSPYSITENDANNYMQSLEWFLNFCSKNNIEGISLSSLYDIFKSK